MCVGCCIGKGDVVEDDVEVIVESAEVRWLLLRCGGHCGACCKGAVVATKV